MGHVAHVGGDGVAGAFALETSANQIYKKGRGNGNECLLSHSREGKVVVHPGDVVRRDERLDERPRLGVVFRPPYVPQDVHVIRNWFPFVGRYQLPVFHHLVHEVDVSKGEV